MGMERLKYLLNRKIEVELRPGIGAESKLRCVERSFVFTAGLILVGTSIGKLIAVMGYDEILYEPDGVFWWWEYRKVLVMAALMEVGIGGVVLVSSRVRWSVMLVAGLATMLLGYRVAGSLLGSNDVCGCLGFLSAMVGVAPSIAGKVAVGTLIYLLIGSYGIVIGRKVYERRKWRVCGGGEDSD